MSSVFLICGNTAAGKSTYSKELANQKSAIHFCLDDWMKNLYYNDYDAQTQDFSWVAERVERCKLQIRITAEALIRQDINVILEFGFGDVQSRKAYNDWAASLGAKAVVHFLDVPVEIRRERIHKRNAEKGPTFSFEVTDDMFNYVEPMFIAPTEAENINIVKITNY